MIHMVFNECALYTKHPYNGMESVMARPQTPAEERFARFVKPNDAGCHEWTSTLARGYGRFWVVGRGQVHAHRFAYEMAYGPIPKGLCVLHKCDNPKCVNPDHLYAGDYTDNARDMVNRGRHWGRRLLADDDVKTIVSLLGEGRLSQREIGEKFGVSQITVSRIKLGKRLYLRTLTQRRK